MYSLLFILFLQFNLQKLCWKCINLFIKGGTFSANVTFYTIGKYNFSCFQGLCLLSVHRNFYCLLLGDKNLFWSCDRQTSTWHVTQESTDNFTVRPCSDVTELQLICFADSATQISRSF